MWTPFHKNALGVETCLRWQTLLVNRGPAHLPPLKGTTRESQRFVSFGLYRQVLLHFSIRHSGDKTTPIAVGRIRKHQHLAARTRVVQGTNGMRHKFLRVRPSLQPALRHVAGGIARFLATRFVRLATPAISSSRNKRRGATTSAIRGSDVRNQFMA